MQNTSTGLPHTIVSLVLFVQNTSTGLPRSKIIFKKQGKILQGIQLIKDDLAKKAFDSLTRIQVGDGASLLFWSDRWIQGRCAVDIAPGITLHISTRIKNARTVAHALQENRWLLDIKGNLATLGARECIRLWLAIAKVVRNDARPDRFLWPWTAMGEYSAGSAYDVTPRKFETKKNHFSIIQNLGSTKTCIIKNHMHNVFCVNNLLMHE